MPKKSLIRHLPNNSFFSRLLSSQSLFPLILGVLPHLTKHSSMRTATPPIPPCSSARKPPLHPHRQTGRCTQAGRCACGQVRTGDRCPWGGTQVHTALPSGAAASLALGACSEPSTPVFTVTFNDFMLVMSSGCLSARAQNEQNAHPTQGWKGHALPVF